MHRTIFLLVIMPDGSYDEAVRLAEPAGLDATLAPNVSARRLVARLERQVLPGMEGER